MISLSTTRNASYKKKTKKTNINELSTTRRESKNNGGLLGGLGYVGGSLVAGVGGIVEGIVDLGAAGVAALGGDTEYAKYVFKDNKVGDWRQSLTEEFNPGGFNQFVGDVFQGIGQSSVMLIPYVGKPAFFAGVISQGISGAAEKTGDVGLKEVAYGTTVGVIEGTLESVLGAAGKGAKSIASSMAKSGGKTAIKSATGTAVRKGLATKVLSSAAGEFLEESASEIVDVGLQRMYKIDPNASTTVKDVLYAGVVGAFSGGVMGGTVEGIQTLNNRAAGRKVIQSGNSQTLVNTANLVADKLAGQGTNFKKAPEWVKTLRGEVDAYNKLVEKGEQDSAKGETILGEMKASLFFAETQAIHFGVTEAIKTSSEENRATLAEYINQTVEKKNRPRDYTAEDIAKDTDGITTQLGIMQMASDTFINYADAIASLEDEQAQEGTIDNVVNELRSESDAADTADQQERASGASTVPTANTEAKASSGVFNASAVASEEKAEAEGPAKNAKFSIKKDSSGNKYVEVDENIVSVKDSPKQIGQTLSEVVKTKFNEFVNVKGQKIGINQKTAHEWIKSKDASSLLRIDKAKFIDKANAFGNADELLQASKKYVGEKIKHERKDSFVEFARGVVDFKVGNNGYSADVIVGTTKSGAAVLYDIVNIQGKKIVASESDTTQSRRHETPATDNSIPQTEQSVNPSEKKDLANPLEDAKYSLATAKKARAKMKENEAKAEKMRQQSAKEAGKATESKSEEKSAERKNSGQEGTKKQSKSEEAIKQSKEALTDVQRQERATENARRLIEAEKAAEPTAKELNVAREYVKGFDNLENSRRLAIIRMIRSAKDVDAKIVKGVANLLAIKAGADLEFRFDEKISQEGVTVSMGEKTLILIGSHTDFKKTVKGTIAHELVHYLERKPGYKAFADHVMAKVKPEVKAKIEAEVTKDYNEFYTDLYTAEAEERGLSESEAKKYVADKMATEEYKALIDSEVVAHVVGRALDNEKLLSRYARIGNTDGFIKRAYNFLSSIPKELKKKDGESEDTRELVDIVMPTIRSMDRLLQMGNATEGKSGEKKYSEIQKDGKYYAPTDQEIIKKHPTISAVTVKNAKYSPGIKMSKDEYKAYRKKQKEAAEKSFGVYTNRDTTYSDKYGLINAEFGNITVRKGNFHGGIALYDILPHIPQIFENAIVLNTKADRDGDTNIKGIVDLVGCATLNDKYIAVVKLNVKEYVNDEAKIYDNKVLTIEELTVVERVGHQDANALSDSTSSAVSSEYIISRFRKVVNTSEKRYLIAGRKAKTADKMSLSRAEEMLKNGADSETVRKETGWFKGYDGKWRFEIDDSKMQVSVPSSKFAKVGDIVEHPTLFEAYPELKEIYVTVHDVKGGRGSYSRVFGDIEISRDLLDSPEDFRDVLIHELQHAIQDKEGFARGASVEYWEKKLVEGYDSRQAYVKAEEQALLARIRQMRHEDKQNGTDFVFDMEELEKQHPDHPRGAINWDTLEKIEEDSPQWKAYDRERDRISEIYGEERVFNYLHISHRLEQIKHTGERFAADLYFDTAGEIEARDVQKRLHLDATERKNTRPDIDREDVVFAEGSVSYYAANDSEENDSVREQLIKHSTQLADMQVVDDVRYTVTNRGKARTDASEIFKKAGYKIDRQGFGIIEIGEKQLSESSNYLNTPAEFAAWMSIPKVLKRGIIISGHDNHKQRGFSSVTIAAPVNINGKRGNVAVVVQQKGKNKYHVHRILMPDGSKFVYENIQQNAEPTGDSIARENSRKRLSISSASTDSIPQKSDLSTVSEKKYSLSKKKVKDDKSEVARLRKKLARERAENAKVEGAQVFAKKDVKIAVDSIEGWTQEEVLSLAKGQELQGMSRTKREEMISQIYIALHEEGAKGNTGEGAIAVKMLATKIANEYIESARVKGEDGKSVHLNEIYDAESIDEFKRQLADLLFGEFANMGQSTRNADFQAAIRAQKEAFFRDQLNDKQLGKETRNLSYQGKKLRELVDTQKREGAAEDISLVTKKLAAVVDAKGNVRVNAVDEAMREAARFFEGEKMKAESAKKLLESDDGKETRALSDFAWEENDGLKFMIDEYLRLREGREGKAFSVEELQLASETLRAMRTTLERYNKEFIDGHWVDAEQAARACVSELTSVWREKEYKNKASKILGGAVDWMQKHYFYKILTPETVVETLEGYAKNGILKQLYHSIRTHKQKAEHLAVQMKKPLADFIDSKDNRYTDKNGRTHSFRKKLNEKMISVDGVDISLGEAIYLLMLTKREEAHAGLLKNGYIVYDDKNQQRATVGISDIMTARSNIYNQLDNTDIEFLKMAEDFFNKTASKIKHDADMKIFGFTNIRDGYYVPMIRDRYARMNGVTDVRQSIGSIITVYNKSFNQNLVENARALEGKNIMSIINDHADGLADYSELYLPLKAFDRIYNRAVAADDGRIRSIREVLNNEVWNGTERYFKDLFADIQGQRERRDDVVNDLVGKIRSGWVNSVLGANLKVVCTQTTSLVSATQVIGAKYIAKCSYFAVPGKLPGLDEIRERAYKYSDIIEARNFDLGAIKSQGNVDKVNAIGEKTGWAIGWMDERICLAIFHAAELQVQEQTGHAVGTEENAVRAAKLADEAIYTTQAMSSASERSALQRSTNEVGKMLSMFTADTVKNLSHLYGNINKWNACRLRVKSGDASYEAEMKKAGKDIRRSVRTLACTGIMLGLITQAFKYLYGREEEEPEDKAKDLVADVAGSTLNILPIVSDIVDKLVFDYDMSLNVLDVANDTLEAVGSSFEMAGNFMNGEYVSTNDVVKNSVNVIKSVGAFFGLPISPVERTVSGLMRFVSPEAAYSLNDALGSSSYTSDLKAAVEKGDEQLAEHILGQLYRNESTGAYTSEELEEVARLYALTDEDGEHYDVLPRKIGTEVNDVKLKAAERKKFNAIYSRASAKVNELIRSEAYDTLTDEQRAKAIKNMYSLYYNIAASEVAGMEVSNAQMYSWLTDNYSSLFTAQAYKSGLDVAKDNKGKEISVRDQFVEYTQNLGLSESDLVVVEFANGVRDKATKAALIAHINSLSLTEEQKAVIAEKLSLEIKDGKLAEKKE